MALDFHDSDSNLASVKFLKYLEFEADSEFSSITQSLQYLESITQQADPESADVQDFAQHLFDVAHKLQTEYLEARLPENPERFAELFQQELENLFNTLPPEIRVFHNLTLESLLQSEPQSTNQEPDSDLSAHDLTPNPASFLNKSLLNKLQKKVKLTPKQLIKVLAACAALSLPSDELQKSDGPEGIYFTPESLAQFVKTSVAEQVNLQWTPLEPAPMLPAVEALQTPAAEAPFELLRQASFPVEVVAAEAPQMKDRLQFVLDTPNRNELFQQLRNDPRYRHDIALLGIIESNLNPDAISHSGAMGPLQDMGSLQGAFGHPDTVASLAAADLLPKIEHPTYNRIVNLHKAGTQIQRGTLLEFLKTERANQTEFWTEFLAQQRQSLITPESSFEIADVYLHDLIEQAKRGLPLNDDPLEALNFAVMSYNLGMGHLHTLRRIMAQNGVMDFNTHSVLTFMDRDDFATILRNNNLGRLHNNYEEAKSYLARYIALQEILHHNQVTTSDSTLG